MDKLKRYIDCYIPTETCNLRCHYCYVTQLRKFHNKLVSFDYSAEHIRKALSKERLGGICLLNLCAGGETLLSEEVLHVVHALLSEGHYVMIVTNGVLTGRFDQIATWDKRLAERLFFKFSFHFMELKRLHLFDKYFANIRKMKEAGCSYTVELTPSDELEPFIEEVVDTCQKYMGTLCQVTIARDDRSDQIEVLSKHSLEEYVKIWSVFDSKLLEYKSTIFYQKRTEFCYAGEWSAYLNLQTGNLTQCYCGKRLDNIYEDLSRPIYFEAIGRHCTRPHCYNGHSFLALGDIPELEAPTYLELRDCVNQQGEHSVKGKVAEFFSQKLKDNQEEYSPFQKFIQYHPIPKFAKRVGSKVKRTWFQ